MNISERVMVISTGLSLLFTVVSLGFIGVPKVAAAFVAAALASLAALAIAFIIHFAF